MPEPLEPGSTDGAHQAGPSSKPHADGSSKAAGHAPVDGASVRLTKRWSENLDARAREGRLRQLPEARLGPKGQSAVDFSSNDYLGLARDYALRQALAERLSNTAFSGSGGSRLLTGNHASMEGLERKAASYHGTEAGLLFGSGYHANAGLIATVARAGDLVLYDRLVHACMHEGMRLSPATARPFAHNSVDALEEALQWAMSQRSGASEVFVLVESVYSMDGDLAPLPAMAACCAAYDAVLLVDEAHAVGLLGPKGAGAVSAMPQALQDVVLARVATYGKAFGASGGMVLGTARLREYLINHCKPFLYTTAPHAAQVEAIDLAYDAVAAAQAERDRVRDLHAQLVGGLGQGPYAALLGATEHAASAGQGAVSASARKGDQQEAWLNGLALQTAVVPIAWPTGYADDGNHAVLKLSEALLAEGYDLRAIRSPTVPKGSERLRCCLHAFNTAEQVDGLLSSLHGLLP